MQVEMRRERELQWKERMAGEDSMGRNGNGRMGGKNNGGEELIEKRE